MLHNISTYRMHFQRFPCTSWTFLRCFSGCTSRRSNCAGLKSIALGQFNLRTVRYLPKDLGILSNLKMKQLLQLRYKTKLLDWMKLSSLSIIIFLRLHMMKVWRFSQGLFFKKMNFQFNKTRQSFDWLVALHKCKSWRSLHADYVISNSEHKGKALNPLNLIFSQVLKLCKKGAKSTEFKIFTSSEIM